jgi:hypothetical protein
VEIIMKTKTGVLTAVVASVVGIISVQAQAHVIKNAVRLGAFEVTLGSYVPLTSSGAPNVSFSGSGKFTISYTAECAASGYVDVDILVDGVPIGPTGGNDNDSFCDFNTRGAMHTVTGRTNSLADGTHTVQVIAHKTDGLAFLSDSSLLIGR